MSILINMEMPSGCRDCGFNYDSKCTLLLDGLDETDGENRRPNCPIVPVPPHGRLIDADEFYKDINESILLTDGFKDTFNLWFDEQQTIIEAEGEE